MRILVINDHTGKVGGAETFIATLRDALEKKGHIVEIFGYGGGEDMSSLFSRWYSRKWYKKTEEKIKEFNPDIVHINNCTRILSPSVISASLKQKIPVILTIHDFHFICPKIWGIRKNGEPCKNWFGVGCIPNNCKGPKKSKFYYPIYLLKLLRIVLHRKIIKNPNLHIFAPSAILAESMEKSLGIRVGVINNGVDIPPMNTSYKKEILFTGRLSENKGLGTIAEILNNVKKYNVNILGEGEQLEEIKSKYKNLNYMGFKKPDPYYKTASIGVVPSVWMENFSYSVLEAMSYGLCLIASNRGGIPEQVINMETGLLFNPGDKKDFKKKLDYLLNNPGEIKRMGKNARERVRKNYSWEKIVGEYGEEYKKAIEKSN